LGEIPKMFICDPSVSKILFLFSRYLYRGARLVTGMNLKT
jgi:hypothetical protein